MAEELKALIEKIKEDGVKAAEEKARSIEEEAKEKASAVMERAKKEAGNLISDAGERIARMEESAKETIRQAGRDLALSLKKEINGMLERIALSHVREALRPEEMAKIITSLVRIPKTEGEKGIVISLGKEDIGKLEKSLLKELNQEMKKGITLRSSGDIRGGFLISYDGGKSSYDFSGKALAEYLAGRIRPNLAEMMKELSGGGKK